MSSPQIVIDLLLVSWLLLLNWHIAKLWKTLGRLTDVGEALFKLSGYDRGLKPGLSPEEMRKRIIEYNELMNPKKQQENKP